LKAYICCRGVKRSGAVGVIIAPSKLGLNSIPKSRPADHGAKNAWHCRVILIRSETFSPPRS
jgi:hypothetical protein